jgi:hypothetical protein
MRARLVISALLFLTPTLRAADLQWPPRIGKWTAPSPAETVAVPGAGEAALPLLQESGFVSTNSLAYRDGDRILPVTLYTFRDSSGAYEAYTFLRSTAASMSTVHLLLLKSNLVLWIRGNSSPSPDDLKAFEAWEQSLSDKIPSPPISSYLPDKDKEFSTERYALGPVGFQQAASSLDQASLANLAERVGFSSGAETMFARYKNGRNEALLLLIDYPTPQLAELHLRHLHGALLAAKQGASIERKGSLLSIVLAPSSEEYAEKLRNAVNYETQVTWNEPSATATDPPWSSVLAKIFVGTGVFMVVAVVLGVAFGGVRVVTKIFFPGKVFDRPEQMDILQLGLSSKPIDSRDLY